MGILGKMIGRTAKGFVVSTATAMTVSWISKSLGLTDSKVGKILAFGIPMMSFVLADDPKLTDLVFKESKKDRKKKKKKKKSRKEAEDNFFGIFGKKGKSMNKYIAKETETTEDEVNSVMSLFFPTFLDAVAEEEPEDSKALGKLFKRDTEEVKKKSPSLAKMAMKGMKAIL